MKAQTSIQHCQLERYIIKAGWGHQGTECLVVDVETDDGAAVFLLEKVKASTEEHGRRAWTHGA
jgi:hypothetical protein